MIKTTAIIISFNRPRYTLDCINSLHKQFPNIHILVGDNGHDSDLERDIQDDIKHKLIEYGGRYCVLPFDCGVGYARNQLFSMVDTQYVLIGDDDFYYTQDAGLYEAETFLDNHSEYSIIGGRVRSRNCVWDYQGYISHTDKIIFTKVPSKQLPYKICPHSRLKYCSIDIMTNCWIGRLCDLPPYDEEHKIYHEHLIYMINLKNKRLMAFTPSMVIDHKKYKYDYPEYSQYRFRQNEKDALIERYGGVKS